MEGILMRRSLFVGSPSSSGVKRLNLGAPSSLPLLRCNRNEFRAQQAGFKVVIPASKLNEPVSPLKAKEWEVEKFQEEIASRDGINVRRRPPTASSKIPNNILEEIVWNKHTEVIRLKEKIPLHTLKNAIKNTPVRDFIQALNDSYLRTGLPALIAEVKKASPSRGVLREKFDPVQVAQAYEKAGASCLSVLADKKYFQGSFENIEAVRNSGIKCPLLCKEFIIDEWQIYYARAKGADAVLLIASVLSDFEIKDMTNICKMLGLATLVEVHNEREMDRVLAIDGIKLIGINNRNLETFEVDITNTHKLLKGELGEIIRQKDIIVVGESGLFTPDDIAYVQAAGVKAILVGESIVKQDDPGKGISGLFGKDISP